MLLRLFTLTFIVLLATGCADQRGPAQEPEFNTGLLRPETYIPASGKRVNMDSVAPPLRYSDQGIYVKAGAPIRKELTHNYHPGQPSAPRPLSGHLIQPGTPLTSPDIPAQGYTTLLKWPEPTFFPPTYQDAYEQHFYTMSIPQGIQSPFIRTLEKDHSGNILIGTSIELAIWDGTSLVSFGLEQGLQARDVWGIYCAPSGKVWMGTRTGGFGVWDGVHITWYDKASGFIDDSVWAFLEDREGRTWIATNDGVAIWDGVRFTRFPETEGLQMKDAKCLLQDRAGNIWIGSLGDGLARWDGEQLVHFSEENGLINDRVRCLLEDQKGRIWIGTEEGVNIFDSRAFDGQGGMQRFTTQEGLIHNRVWDIEEDRSGQIWIASLGGGISVWDGTGLRHYTAGSALGNNNVLTLLEDAAGNMWIGTDEGINIRTTSNFQKITKKTGLSSNMLRNVMEDRQGRIWLGAHPGGFNIIDGESLTLYSREQGLSDISVYSFLEDSRGRVWLGTHDGGINLWDGKSFRQFPDMEPIYTTWVWSIVEDQSKHIWMASWGNGLLRWNETGFDHFTSEQGLSDDDVNRVLVDRTGQLWVATDRGVSVWDGKAFVIFTMEDGLAGNDIWNLHEDQTGKIWIGSYGNGLSVWDGEGFHNYYERNGLNSNWIRAIEEDHNGHIWVATVNGLNRLIPQSEDGVYKIDQVLLEDGLGSLTINAMTVDRRNDLWLATMSDGVIRVDTDFLREDTVQPTLSLTNIQPRFGFIDWKALRDEADSVRMAFDSVPRYSNLPVGLQLPHDQNSLELNWKSSDPLASNMQYTYYLEGNDRDWSPLTEEAVASYQNLSPGSFTFHVRGVRKDGAWSETASYNFLILPPWWLTWWAQAFYAIAGVLLVFGLIRWRTAAQRKKIKAQEKQLIKEREYSERLEKVDRIKDQFLANTSHELRTPLQGIIGISESLHDQAEQITPGELRENLAMTISSGKRLNNLINDILDFSKLKNFDIQLLRRPVNLRVLADIVLRNNAPLVSSKPLELINAVPGDLPAVHGDENRLQQILYNLIGNAIKFTEEGHVRFAAREIEGMIEARVEDTGPGIPESQQQAIFEEFEQGDGSISRSYTGTGLGLSISKRLVELHGGQMWVESEAGRGATFLFTLPVSVEKATTLAPQEDHPMVQKAIYTTDIAPMPMTPSFDNGDDIRLLIVDDEPINQQVLKNHLAEQNFTLTQALNGEEALTLLKDAPPFDLVLLDVMMPRMSGYEVCQQIREQYLPSELPVIMVTAKNQLQDIVQGLTLGANDYLAKPFHKEELLARIHTQLDLHRIFSVAGRFVPNEFLHSLNRARLTEVQLGDFAEKVVTVLFADIRDYTALSEKMTPEENFRFVNAFHRRMGPVIQQHGGFVNQYLGDAIMAIFPGSPEDALRAAIDLLLRLREYNQQRRAAHREPIKVGIGLHTGALIMGIIGDRHRMDATTISDTVNTASRIESLTKHYGVSVLLSQDSLDQIGDPTAFQLRYLGRVQVKGKKEPIGIYDCFSGEAPEQAARKQAAEADFQRGLDHYFRREFPEAATAFNAVLKADPDDDTARLFLHKSSTYTVEGVAEDWTGVEVMRVK